MDTRTSVLGVGPTANTHICSGSPPPAANPRVCVGPPTPTPVQLSVERSSKLQQHLSSLGFVFVATPLLYTVIYAQN